jgi:putative ABC transport system permease protein
MIADLRQALRSLLKSPSFTAIVVAVLAVGIGATTAIFSIVNGVLFKPLPFADPSSLVALQTLSRGEPDDVSYPDVRDWATQSQTLDHVAAYAENGATLTGDGEAESLSVVAVTGDFFETLGVPPLRGRWLHASDDVKGGARFMVISEGLWTKRFARADTAIGRTVTLDGQPATIVGVMPSSFEFPFEAEPMQAWLPTYALGLTATFAEQRGASFMRGLGHLRPRTSLAQANAEFSTITARLAAQYPDSNKDRTVDVVPLRQVLIHDYRTGLIVLLATVGLVLLIACANVANLLLARGIARRREMAIRTALGASRGRLVRQLLTEAVALAVVGGGAGLLLASWCEAALIAASPLDIPRLHAVHLDAPVLIFALGVSVLTAIAFGLVPAMQVSRAEAGDTLKDEGRGSSGGRSARLRQMLIVGEVALSFVLLVGAGLLVRSLLILQNVDPGFIAEHAVAIEVMLPHARYPDAADNTRFYHQLLEKAQAIPGVSVAGISTTLPLSGSSIGVGFEIEGRTDDATHRKASPRFFAISPDYFAAMRIRLLRGRAFTARDNDTSPAVAIVSETIARRDWPGEDPIGKRVKLNYNKTGWREVVGVVADVKGSTLAEPTTGSVYSPFSQTPWPFMSAVVRTTGDAAALGSALRATVPAIDPMLAPPEVKLLTKYVSHATATSRFTAALIGSFAALALLLAGFGLYGIMSHHVVQRQREIGIRMALGAQASDVRSLVVSQALRMGLTGLIVGLAAALAVARVIASLLFGISPGDPVTFSGVCTLLVAVVLVAAYLPARRATRVDPIVALRTE